MASVCFYFQVHQPYRLRRYTIFDSDADYFDEYHNKQIIKKVAEQCYLPTNKLILDLINKYPGRFKVAYSCTGVVLEQLQSYAPEVMSTFHALADTGAVEFLAETYYHSLAFLHSRQEFSQQVKMHSDLIEHHFKQRPSIFRNTELIYNNDLAAFVAQMGYRAILLEGADQILGYRSPNFLYHPPGDPGTTLLLKNYRLADDIAFRFSQRSWAQWPLTAKKFADWIHQVNGNGYTVNLFMDYETFGEHQWAETGIFDFLEQLPQQVLTHPEDDFKTPSELVQTHQPRGELDVPYMISWADTERDLSAWLGNAMQSNALYELYRLEQQVKDSRDEDILRDWRKLQISDHFYYMCTKYFADGDVHRYFNPYESPYDSYINFMNVLDNLRSRLR